MLLPRQVRCRGYSQSVGYYDCYTPWSDWGRWVFLAGIILLFLVFFLLACISARRRRRAGLRPYRGTGWMGGPPAGHGPAVYTAQHSTSAPPYQAHPPPNDPAPQYTPQPQQSYFGNNTGYYGPQSGVELQSPSNAYQPQRGGEPVYTPPPGPPPAHNKPL